MQVECNGKTIEIEMSIEEWNAVLGALNHTTAFPGTPANKFDPLNAFRALVQKACWHPGEAFAETDKRAA